MHPTITPQVDLTTGKVTILYPTARGNQQRINRQNRTFVGRLTLMGSRQGPHHRRLMNSISGERVPSQGELRGNVEPVIGDHGWETVSVPDRASSGAMETDSDSGDAVFPSPVHVSYTEV